MSTSQDRGDDLIDVLSHDHREILESFAALETGDPTVSERRELANVVVAELTRHIVAEEQYLYPTVRRVLPDGDRLADHATHDHAEAESDMKRLEGLEATNPDFQFVLSRLMAEIRQHILTEETDIFPPLRAAADPEELRDLGRKAQSVRKLAPTRAHPGATDRTPVDKLLNPALGLVDRIRDALSRRA